MTHRLAKICPLLPFALLLAIGSLPAFAEEVKKHNDRGNLIYSKDIDGNEIWYEYDENGNQYYKRKGNEYWTCFEPEKQGWVFGGSIEFNGE